MVSRAVAKYVRTSDRKVRLIIDLIRGKRLPEARRILAGLKKRARVPVGKVLGSALSNAKQIQPGISEDNLYISKIVADDGPTLRRHRPQAMGRATVIRKRSCHITVELDTIKT